MRPTLADLADAVSEARDRLATALPDAGQAARPVAVGWVTVETERAERELAEAFGTGLGVFGDAPDDAHPRRQMPDRGRADQPGSSRSWNRQPRAASRRLSHDWARVRPWSGSRTGSCPTLGTSAPSAGPFGPERLVDRGVRDGRHVLLLEGEPGTIGT